MDRLFDQDVCTPSATAISRRALVGAGATVLGASALAASLGRPVAAGEAAPSESLIADDAVVLFQGDSITDAGRDRGHNEPNDQRAMGSGYAWLAAAQMLVGGPTRKLSVFNRGVSGNKVFQLAERWQADCLDLKPDVLSILIGVNDVLHRVNGNYDGTIETYRTDYRKLLERTKAALPNVKLVICEPFVLKCGAVTDAFFPAMDDFRAAAAEICKEFAGRFVPFQSMFDEAAKIAPKEHWAGDGVHPSSFGATLMAGAWLRAVGEPR